MELVRSGFVNTVATPFSASNLSDDENYEEDEEYEPPRRSQKKRGPKLGHNHHGNLMKYLSELRKGVDYNFETVKKWINVPAPEFVRLNWVLHSKEFKERYLGTEKGKVDYSKCSESVQQYAAMSPNLSNDQLLHEVKQHQSQSDQLKADIHSLNKKLKELRVQRFESDLKREISHDLYIQRTDDTKERYEYLKDLFNSYEAVLKAQQQVS